MKKGMILLPNGKYMKREYRKALVMEKGYEERYMEFVYNHTPESVVLIYIIQQMENNEYTASYKKISDGLSKKGISYSVTSVARAVRLIKEQYSDLVTVIKTNGTNKFIIDKNRCFKA